MVNPQIKVISYSRFLRQEKGMSLNQLSQISGFSKSCISRMENSQIYSVDLYLKTITESFGIDFNDSLELNKEIEEGFNQIIYQIIMFDSNWNRCFKQLKSKESAIICTTNYPVYILIKYFVYCIKNINHTFIKKYTKSIEKVFYGLSTKQQKTFLLARMANLFFLSEYNEALSIFKRIETCYKVNDVLDSLMYHLVMLIYSDLGQVDNIKFYLTKAKEISMKIHNIKRFTNLMINEANLLGLMNFYDQALQCSKENLKLCEQYDISEVKFTILNNIAVSYYWLKEYEASLEFYKKALLETTNADNALYFSIAELYFRLNDYKNCRKYIKLGQNSILYKEIYGDLLNWLEAMANKRYSQKAKRLLLKCYQNNYDRAHIQTKKYLLNLLIEQFQYEKNIQSVQYFQKEMNTLNKYS